MAVDKISPVIEALASAFSKVSGIGVWMFLAGFTILLVIGFSFALVVFIRALKEIPNLTVSQFLKLTIALAVILMIVGLIIP